MMQLQMRILLLYQEGSSSENVDSAIFVWRTSTTYFPAIIGFGGFITYLIIFIKARKQKQPIFKK
jgi:uncharacterized membrane protein YbhN (UPF0104 family)